MTRAVEPSPPGQPASEVAGPVTAVELFFDLVFAFAVTQLSAILVQGLSALAMFQVVLLFGVTWWMYSGYAWLTNTIPPTRWSRRLPLLAGMAGFMVVALATPRAFTGGGVIWGLGYLMVVVVHTALYLQVNRSILRVFPINLAAAVLTIVAGLLTGPAVYVLWVAALVVPIATPYLVRVGRFSLRPEHMVERYGLALLIIIGESVVAVGAGAAGQPLDAGVLATMLLGLALVTALWWTYFGGDDERVGWALEEAEPDRRSLLVLRGYFYATIPLVLGVVTLAAGLRQSLGHALDPVPSGPALAVAGGAALFLIGAAWLRRAFRIGPISLRLAAAVLALPSYLLAARLASAAQLVALFAVFVAMLAFERARERRSP
jgi:low temperature requirement protein LtrA